MHAPALEVHLVDVVVDREHHAEPHMFRFVSEMTVAESKIATSRLSVVVLPFGRWMLPDQRKMSSLSIIHRTRDEQH